MSVRRNRGLFWRPGGQDSRATHRLKPEHWGPLFSNVSAGKARLQAKALTDLGLNLENRFPVLIQ